MKTPSSTRRFRSGIAVAAVGAMLLTTVAARADYNSVVLGDTPAVFYSIAPDGSGTDIFTDLTGNGNAGGSANVYPVPGPSAFLPNAGSFDPGSQSKIAISNSGNPTFLNFSGPITLEAWVQPSSTGEFGNIIAKGYDGNLNDAEIVLRVNGNGNGNNYYGSSGSAGVNGAQQTTNWAHVVLSSDGTNCTLYVNGTPSQPSSDTSGSINFSDNFAIGTGTDDGAGRFFSGNIAGAAIYKHGLTAAQVQAHYFQGMYGVTNLDNSVPIFTTQPQPQTAYPGGTVAFTFQVLSTLPTTNQWLKANVPIPGQTNATLALFNVQPGDAVNYSVVVGNANGPATSSAASLTLLTTGNSLLWTGTNNSVWDLGGTANWINQANSSQTVFNNGDQVLFNDAAGAPTNPQISGSVSPSFVIFDTANNYLLNNAGTMTGPVNLIKQGSGSVTVQPGPYMTGGVLISGGTLAGGNNTFNFAAAITVTNNATWDFADSSIENGKPIIVSGTGVGGEGAIFNSSFANYGQLLDITLAGNATFGALGGNSRWDLAPGSTLSGPFKVTLNYNDSSGYSEWDTVAIGPEVGDIEIAQGALGLKGDGSSIGNPNSTITADAGTQLIFWNSSFGTNSGYAKNIHVLTNASVAVRTSPDTYVNANFVLEGGAEWDFFNGSGSGQTIKGTIVLNGPTRLQVGDGTVTVTNVISGVGGFVWQNYNNQMVFTAANTYSGPTVIGDGRNLVLSGNGSISHSSPIFFGGTSTANIPIDVTGRPDHTLTLATGQSLSGNGTVNGNLVVSSGASITPAGTNMILGITLGGNATGTLAASTNVTLNGTTTIKLNGSGVNDVIQAGGDITYGGTLNLVNISGNLLANGNSFQVFNAATYSQSFANITPATPGSGLTWDFSQLNHGIIAVVGEVQPVVNSVAVSGTNFILGGINGKANGSFLVLSSTNATTQLSNWVVLSTNSFDGTGAFRVTNGIAPGVPSRFFSILQQ